MALGDHTRYNEEAAKGICDNIKLGVTVRRVAALANIHPQTLYNWIAYCDPDDEKYNPKHPAAIDDFAQRVLTAQSQFEQRHLAHLEKGAKSGDTKCSMFLLERKFPKEWGRKDKFELEHTGPGGQPMENKITVTFVKPKGDDNNGDGGAGARV